MAKVRDTVSSQFRCGEVPLGWGRKAWVEHLRELANRCRQTRPDMAEEYDRWADMVEARGERCES